MPQTIRDSVRRKPHISDQQANEINRITQTKRIQLVQANSFGDTFGKLQTDYRKEVTEPVRRARNSVTEIHFDKERQGDIRRNTTLKEKPAEKTTRQLAINYPTESHLREKENHNKYPTPRKDSFRMKTQHQYEPTLSYPFHHIDSLNLRVLSAINQLSDYRCSDNGEPNYKNIKTNQAQYHQTKHHQRQNTQNNTATFKNKAKSIKRLQTQVQKPKSTYPVESKDSIRSQQTSLKPQTAWSASTEQVRSPLLRTINSPTLEIFSHDSLKFQTDYSFSQEGRLMTDQKSLQAEESQSKKQEARQAITNSDQYQKTVRFRDYGVTGNNQSLFAAALLKQTELDKLLRLQKHLFSGLLPTLEGFASLPWSWRRLHNQLTLRGRPMSVTDLIDRFLNKVEELDPFTSVKNYSKEEMENAQFLAETFCQAEQHWQQQVLQRWTREQLILAGLTKLSHGRSKVTVQDWVIYISQHCGKWLANRDVVILHERICRHIGVDSERTVSIYLEDVLAAFSE